MLLMPIGSTRKDERSYRLKFGRCTVLEFGGYRIDALKR